MNTFYHSKDNGLILLDISKHIEFLASFGVAKKDLRISTGNISLKEGTQSPSFYCLECSKEVKLNEIKARCYYCGDEFNLTDLYRITDSGGPYCQDCAINKFPDSQRIKLTTIFARVSFERF